MSVYYMPQFAYKAFGGGNDALPVIAGILAWSAVVSDADECRRRCFSVFYRDSTDPPKKEETVCIIINSNRTKSPQRRD